MSKVRGVDVFEIEIDEMLSPDAQSKMLADFAREQIAIVRSANRRALGVDASYRVTVDGQDGKPLDSVRPDGEIVADFDLLGDTLEWIHGALVNASPVLTGQYYSSFILLADGVEVKLGPDVPFAEEYVFVSTMPYARKIERGLSKQAPDGVFQVVAALAKRRLGNIAKVQFSYRSLIGVSALDSWAQTTSLSRGRLRMKPAARAEWLRRQPAIVVRPN